MVPFIQFQKREKHLWRSVTFSKVEGKAYNFTKSNISPWIFFTFFKLYKWYQIAQRMKMNCFCGMVDRRKAFSLISSRNHCQRSSPSRISNPPRARFEPAQNMSSGLVEWSCAVVITTTPWRQNHYTTAHHIFFGYSNIESLCLAIF